MIFCLRNIFDTSDFQAELRQPNEGMGSIIPIKCRATFHKIVKMWSVAESCVSEFRAAPGDTCVSKFRVTPGDTCPDRAIRILRQNLAWTAPPSSRQKKETAFLQSLLVTLPEAHFRAGSNHIRFAEIH